MSHIQNTNKNIFLQSIEPYVNKDNFYKISEYISNLINSGKTPVYTKIVGGFSVSGLDIYINGLNAGLNDVADGSAGSDGAGGSGFIKDIKGVIKDVDFNNIFGSISGLFSGLDCIGGSAFSKSRVDRILLVITKHFTDRINEINRVVQTPSNSNIVPNYELNVLLDEFKTHSQRSAESYYHKKHNDGTDWNSCSSKGLSKIIRITKWYDEGVYPSLLAWLSQYYIITPNGNASTQIDERTLEYTYNFEGSWIGKGDWINKIITKPVTNANNSFQLKNGTYSIVQFEFTPLIQQQAGTHSDDFENFNINAFLSTLTNTISEVNNGSVNNWNGNNNNGGTGQFQTALSNNSGMSKTLIGGTIAVACTYGLYKAMNSDAFKKLTKK